MAVKSNQPKLYRLLQDEFEKSAPQRIDDLMEQMRNRILPNSSLRQSRRKHLIDFS
jgi:hypothetical protein